VLWDFDGHGASPKPPASDGQRNSLVANAEAALVLAREQGYGDPQRVAILGHSMGTGAALAYGQEHPETAATIAVSPVGVEVTPNLPRNLLLMAGELEPRFLRNAEVRLAEAGGAGGDMQAGTGRNLVAVPGVEHITILFSPTAHAAARDWLDATFGRQVGASNYRDRRMTWYGLAVLGSLLLAIALAPLLASPPRQAQSPRPLWRRLAAFTGGAVGATLVLWLAGEAGLPLRTLLGLQVGGYLLLWFGLAGVLSMALLWQRPLRLALRGVSGGLLSFAILWLGVGLIGHWVWLPWLLIPRRLVLWPLGVLMLLPWFLAAGQTRGLAGPPARAGWWLAHTLVLVAGMLLAVTLSSSLGFIMLILPVYPIMLGLHALATGAQRDAWPFAISGALYLSWVLLSVFPLA
jgi:pimeloyl-ACP methyl ester carboxylesterase